MKKSIGLSLGLALALCSCAISTPSETEAAGTITPEEDLALVREAYGKSTHILVGEKDDWGHRHHKESTGEAIIVEYREETRYFDSSFNELKKEEFDEGESFYVYWGDCLDSDPRILIAIYCYEG